MKRPSADRHIRPKETATWRTNTLPCGEERWGKLTDDDFKTAAGKKENLVGKIQERYGIAKQEAEKQIDEWSSALKESDQGDRS